VHCVPGLDIQGRLQCAWRTQGRTPRQQQLDRSAHVCSAPASPKKGGCCAARARAGDRPSTMLVQGPEPQGSGAAPASRSPCPGCCRVGTVLGVPLRCVRVHWVTVLCAFAMQFGLRVCT